MTRPTTPITVAMISSLKIPMDDGDRLDEGVCGHNLAIDDVINLINKNTRATTVADLARAKYPTGTFDTALPQQWVNSMAERGFDARGHFVTMYPTGQALGFYMAPITDEGVEMAARVASMEA